MKLKDVDDSVENRQPNLLCQSAQKCAPRRPAVCLRYIFVTEICRKEKEKFIQPITNSLVIWIIVIYQSINALLGSWVLVHRSWSTAELRSVQKRPSDICWCCKISTSHRRRDRPADFGSVEFDGRSPLFRYEITAGGDSTKSDVRWSRPWSSRSDRSRQPRRTCRMRSNNRSENGHFKPHSGCCIHSRKRRFKQWPASIVTLLQDSDESYISSDLTAFGRFLRFRNPPIAQLHTAGKIIELTY